MTRRFACDWLLRGTLLAVVAAAVPAAAEVTAQRCDHGAVIRIDGQPFAEYLGRSGADVIFDLEVTPNRPDLNSVIGIAREVAAITGNPLRIPEVKPVISDVPTDSLVEVRM